jgi:RsiW-degrading membrane proteinase PrsW (M82 family)
VICDHCGKQVPEAVFCTNCGAHQGKSADTGDPRARHHQYAAAPGEHVAQPSVFSTLLPHLGHTKVHEFRWAFLIGLAIVVILVATGLVVAALLAAIFLIPVLYLVYLYEAQVYRDEPVLVLGATFIGGIILGLAVTLLSNAIIGLSIVQSTTALIGYTVIVPIIQLIVMPLPALLLRNRAGFTETVDGLAFGVASGLGFSISESIVRFSNVFANTGIHTDSTSWIYPLVGVAVLIPLLHGSTSGALAAGLWRFDRTGRARDIAAYAVPISVIATIGFYYVGQLLANNGVAPLIVLLYQAIPVALLLVYIRFLLHYSLLEEARDLGFHAVVCPNCHRHVMAAGFCPNCGVAFTAAPRPAATPKVADATSTPTPGAPATTTTPSEGA